MTRVVCILPLWLVVACGCTMIVRPAAEVREPATVYIADYQIHASLLLPREDGTLAEYAYGQWDWFALNREGVLDALRIAAFPSRGTLGRRTLESAEDGETLRARMGVEAVHPLTVAREQAAALLKRLDADYASKLPTEIYNPKVQMTFVHCPRLYWTGWNCNHALAAWLEELGCDVGGCRAFADFQIE
jgi:hypothetical protein